MMNNKLWKIVFTLVVVSLLFSVFQYKRAERARTEATLLRLSRDSIITLKDSSIAFIAGVVKSVNDLSSALAAEKELNGKLIAAANIKITPKPVIGTVTTGTTTKEQIRTLKVHDVLSTGTMIASITAPPFPSDLIFEYQYTPAPLDVGVSLLSINDTTAIFVVKYTGGETRISSSYAKIPTKEKVIRGYLEGLYSLTLNKEILLRTGLIIKLPFTNKLYGVTEAQHIFGSDVSFVGAGIRFYF